MLPLTSVIYLLFDLFIMCEIFNSHLGYKIQLYNGGRKLETIIVLACCLPATLKSPEKLSSSFYNHSLPGTHFARSTHPSQRSKYTDGVVWRMRRCVAIQRLSRKCVQKKYALI